MKYIGYLIALMSVLFGTEFFLLKCFRPEYYFPLLATIPLFFTLFGYFAIRFVYLKPRSSIAVVMGVKMLKILISLILILLYVSLIKENSVAFLFSYLLYFFAYLAFETWMLYSINKKKSTKRNEQP